MVRFLSNYPRHGPIFFQDLIDANIQDDVVTPIWKEESSALRCKEVLAYGKVLKKHRKRWYVFHIMLDFRSSLPLSDPKMKRNQRQNPRFSTKMVKYGSKSQIGSTPSPTETFLNLRYFLQFKFPTRKHQSCDSFMWYNQKLLQKLKQIHSLRVNYRTLNIQLSLQPEGLPGLVISSIYFGIS